MGFMGHGTTHAWLDLSNLLEDRAPGVFGVEKAMCSGAEPLKRAHGGVCQ